MFNVQSFSIPPEPLHPDSPQAICHCKDCGNLLDAQLQADGAGDFFIIVTCFNPQCELRYVTRSLESYKQLTEQELESYKVMNRTAVKRG